MIGSDDVISIKPVSDLRNKFTEIEELVNRGKPVYLTKNGYGDMVIMSMKTYEEKMFILDVHNKLAEAEKELNEGKVLDGDASLKSIREKYNV